VFDYTYHDDETMNKVYKGMKRANVPNELIADAVNCIMNQGVVFRELKPPTPVTVAVTAIAGAVVGAVVGLVTHKIAERRQS
jgi:hypothetical protein